MNTKLFVRNLSWSITEKDLYTLFGEAGEVSSVVIPMRREDGKPRGFAFIEMESPEAGQKAIQCFNGFLLDGRDLVVDFQDEDRGIKSFQAEKSNKLFIRNVSYSVSEYELQELLQQVGTVISVRIPTDRDTGEQKGFAFAEMATANDAQQVIDSLNNSHLKGREIVISYQDSNRVRSKPARSGSYGQQHSGSFSNRW